MRRIHRLLAPAAALFILVIALTGVGILVTSIADQATRPHVAAAAADAALGKGHAAPPKQKRSALGEWEHTLKRIHSGAAFGPFGTAVAILSGLALTFFAGSGFWMWASIWLRRQRRRRSTKAPNGAFGDLSA